MTPTAAQLHRVMLACADTVHRSARALKEWETEHGHDDDLYSVRLDLQVTEVELMKFVEEMQT